MQLSVACNLILKGVRTITGRWIISHRCSWITVYVLCCNAQNEPHSNNLACISLYSVNRTSVICSPSMLYIFYGETPLVNCGPRSFLYTDKSTTSSSVYFLQFCSFILLQTFLPHQMVNPLFLANR